MPELEIKENVQLAPFTTMKIGGMARFFVRAESEANVIRTLEFAATHSLPVFVLGGGSNVLISDSGFDGVVLQIGISGFEFQAPRGDLRSNFDSKLILVGAGEDWDGFVGYCVSRDLAGIENLSGIPGFVGGTPVQNVGAYGQEVSETIINVRCLDRKTLKIVMLTNADCDFAYRRSIFNSTMRDRYVVLAVTFALIANGKPNIGYKDLREHFGERTPCLTDVREAVLSIRRIKSMVIDAADPDSRSAGSFFKNPIVSREIFCEVATSHGRVPNFPVDQDRVKIPAAWLIENAGFHRGFRKGNVGISANHTLAIVNFDHATAAEVIALKDDIQSAVRTKFGIKLQPEPIFIGF